MLRIPNRVEGGRKGYECINNNCGIRKKVYGSLSDESISCGAGRKGRCLNKTKGNTAMLTCRNNRNRKDMNRANERQKVKFSSN